MTIDYDKYRHFLDGYDMTEEQKKRHIEAVYHIMGRFVDQAFYPNIHGARPQNKQKHLQGTNSLEGSDDPPNTQRPGGRARRGR